MRTFGNTKPVNDEESSDTKDDESAARKQTEGLSQEQSVVVVSNCDPEVQRIRFDITLMDFQRAVQTLADMTKKGKR
jgi:DNA-binding protein YbaB